MSGDRAPGSLTAAQSASTDVPEADGKHRRRRVDVPALAGLLGATGLVALFSVPVLAEQITAWAPWVMVPSALGAPFGLPALRLVPLGDLTWATTVVDTVAALLLLATVYGRLARRRPAVGPGRVFFHGWGALVAAAALAGMVRGAYIGGVTPTGLVAGLTYAALGLALGAVWGALLGWVVGALASLARLASRGGGSQARSWLATAGRGTAIVALASLAWFAGALASGPLDARGPQPGVALPRIAPASFDGSSQEDEMLRGLNSSGTATSAADGQSWVTPADIARERVLLGSNSVRYLVFWDKVEPQPGQYDETYIDAVDQRVQWYSDEGFDVVLSLHQDAWGPSVGFDGAPDWATVTDGLAAQPQQQWVLTYLQPGVLRAFDHFWRNTGRHDDLQASYLAMVGLLVDRFADDPAVIGIDVMNEPFGGSLQGPLFEQGPLSAFYQRAIDVVRAIDDDLWVFVEPQAFGVNQGLPSGLTTLTDPRDGDPRIAYAPHLYPLPLDLGGGYADNQAWVDRSIELWADRTRATSARLATPLWLGEFGLDGTKPGAPDYVRTVVATLQSIGASGFAYWDNSPGPRSPWSNDDPTQRSAIGDALAER
jgi:aryl-phospho-beta-D-glucosidase BglC (GH1 family)